MDRRKFCGLAGATVLTVAAARATAGAVEPGPKLRLPAGPPKVGKRWAMVVDLTACAEHPDCKEVCIAACHRVHNVPDIGNPKEEVKWIWQESYRHALPDDAHEHASDRLKGTNPLVFCNHCDNPPCTRVCPTGATYRRDQDGLVIMDWHRCIGCRYCVAACPYGSRSFNWRDPRPFIKDVDPSFPTRTRGVVEKCTFCDERLARGQDPACVEACPHGAMVFGDLEDSGGKLREILRARHTIRRRPALGTEPQVYYVV